MSAGPDPDPRLFTGPRGERISTAAQRYLHPDHKITAPRRSTLRAPRSLPDPIVMTR